MEISAFAEQLLYGVSLDDKLLAPPVTLTDEQPGSGVAVPRYPGRPKALRLDRWNEEKKVPFPSLDKLVDAKSRGQVLHFFANHELLAIELMALALLKFPDAPANFRRGLVQTIFEEQAHMRLYAQHMQKMGVEFGEIPVNDFFWTCLSPMTSPLDFVAHMSLTFEQANLDFSLHFAKVFKKVGDEEGAKLLEQVFKDEVGHVKHGLVWLNRWKEVHESDWDAYVRLLRFPITPNRAKGLAFVTDLRREIGFSEKFISELSVFTHTKGRPPCVHVYNPGIESTVASIVLSPAEQKISLAIENDFSSLLMFLARHDDLVLVRQKPAADFLLSLKKVGVNVPEFATYQFDESANTIAIDSTFEHKNLGEVVAWAYSDELITSFLKLPFLTKSAREKLTATNVKKQWYGKGYLFDLMPAFCDPISVKANSVEKAVCQIEELFTSHGRVVVKAPYSSSGRQRLLLESAADPTLKPWLKKTIAKQQTVVIEPWLEKICDLSLQLFIHSDAHDGVEVIGWTRFLTDTRGQYLGTVLGRPLEDLPASVKKIFYQNASDHSLAAWQNQAVEVAKAFAADGYRGPMGIDAFYYFDKNDHQSIKLRPVVEVNARLTMGRLALNISRFVLSAQFAVWILVRVQDILQRFSSIDEFVAFCERTWPADVHSAAQIRSGIVFTTDPRQATLFVTILCVGQNTFSELLNLTNVNKKHVQALAFCDSNF